MGKMMILSPSMLAADFSKLGYQVKEAEKAAASAKPVGDTSTIYHYGMKVLVHENGGYTWYQISKNNVLIAEATRDVPRPRSVPTAAEMDAILANATVADIGTIYKYVGNATARYEYGVLYELTSKATDGDEVSH